MILVIKNGIVITMDEKRKEKYEKLDIVIENDTIIKLEKDYSGTYDKIIDATNKIVMPGLINCHTHLGMSIFRATNDSLNLDDWLNKKIWPIENNMTDDDIYYTSLLSIVEMIKTGTTCCADMYFGCLGTLKALKETNFRTLFSRCLMDADNKGEEHIKEFLELYKSNQTDLIKWALTLHAFYTCSKDYLKQGSDLALELDLPLHIHFCENESEVKSIKKDYGTLNNALESTGLLRNKLILAHATFLSDDVLASFKDKNVSLVHNPVSNLNLGCGIADISKYRQYSNVCLGTDGQGSGNNMNLFYHMSLVDLLQKGLYKNPTIFNSYEVLKTATINGAKALGLDKEIGSIEENKKADIIIVSLDNIESYPTVDIINNVVHNTSASNVDTTIINGQILLEERNLKLDINENELKENITSILERLKV